MNFFTDEMSLFTGWLLDFPSTNQEQNLPDNKVHGADMGPIWGRQDPVVPHVGPMNFVIWATINGNMLIKNKQNRVVCTLYVT